MGFSKGVVQYVTGNKYPIFPLSRKINKTKKRGKYHKSYYAFLDEKMPNKEKGSSKKLDQKLQNKFEKMTPEEQEQKDVTLEAIRCLNTCQEVEAKRILENLETKYFKHKEHADLLDLFARLAWFFNIFIYLLLINIDPYIKCISIKEVYSSKQ